MHDGVGVEKAEDGGLAAEGGDETGGADGAEVRGEGGTPGVQARAEAVGCGDAVLFRGGLYGVDLLGDLAYYLGNPGWVLVRVSGSKGGINERAYSAWKMRASMRQSPVSPKSSVFSMTPCGVINSSFTLAG